MDSVLLTGLRVGTSPKVVHLEAHWHQKDRQENHTPSRLIPEQNTEPTEQRDDARPQHGNLRRRHTLRRGVGCHHGHITEVVKASQREEPSIEDSSSKKEKRHCSLLGVTVAKPNGRPVSYTECAP